ncbi:MAG: 5'-nucleotidase [Sulfurimonadaceae bacterium]|nr:5'-nucleotidase [Sulfurimonadaceae bacterium]
MPYELDKRLVIGVASSAMFDLSESDTVYRTEGENAYREHQEKHRDKVLGKGVAFSFIKRLLSLNDLSDDPRQDPLVEVVLLSRNDPETGLRVMNSIQHYGLEMTRAIFLQGRAPYAYIPALNISLFLSANETDVNEAIKAGYPAGMVMDSLSHDDEEDTELRIAIDFDGVVIDDEAETVFQQTNDVEAFHRHEQQHVLTPHNPGPLADFLRRVAVIQAVEAEKREASEHYENRLRVSIVTARNAPSHERVVNTLKSWGIMVNEAFFLGGIEKRKVLEVLRPHIFFDDQKGHLESASNVTPSVHIPFGIANSD